MPDSSASPSAIESPSRTCSAIASANVRRLPFSGGSRRHSAMPAPSVMLVRLLHADVSALRAQGGGGGALLPALRGAAQRPAGPGRDHRRHQAICEASTAQPQARCAPVDHSRAWSLVCGSAGQRPCLLYGHPRTARDRDGTRPHRDRRPGRDSARSWWSRPVGVLRVRCVPYRAKPDATSGLISARPRPARRLTQCRPQPCRPSVAGVARERRVLLIEDDADLADLYVTQLRRDGIPLELAQTGAQADAFVRDRVPALILVDLKLPDVDGREL